MIALQQVLAIVNSGKPDNREPTSDCKKDAPQIH